jgi:GTP-binding protein HflX
VRRRVRSRRLPARRARKETSIDKVHGALSGLKKNQIKRLGNLYRRRIPPEAAVTGDLARAIATLALEINAPVSVLIDRRGRIVTVAAADADGTPLPPRAGEAEARLRGLRLVHVHPGGGGLSDADLSALFLARLDAVVAVEAFGDPGAPELGPAHLALVAPPTSQEEDWLIDPPASVHVVEREDLSDRVRALEEEMARSARSREVSRSSAERAVLIGLDTGDGPEAQARLQELTELVRSAGATVAKAEMQHKSRPDPKTLIGRGKLRELVSLAYHEDADLLVFDRELSPGQAREIEEATRLKVLDRTQVILDIFAQNARGREARVQVELAQLHYQLPRLAGRGAALSRLGGGIGTRGPGETKLEVDRRRLRDRIVALEAEVDRISHRRERTRKNRTVSSTPVVALVGYTNAGKSTLFNALAKSDALSRDALFATLRPTSREGWLPALGPWGGKVVYTDTVGFIRDLPDELVDAFRATLEELDDADLLLHVVDGAAPGAPDRAAAVERILDRLELTPPRLVVLNKADAMDPVVRRDLEQRFSALSVSARDGDGLDALRARLAEAIEGEDHVPLPDDPAAAWGVVAPLKR